MTRLTFTVDARLLRELGERLVGRPHMALAELIKNSYDADARNVELFFADNTIIIVDDGHGMSRADFVDRWMRVGTPFKENQKTSPALARPLTGSKGVGRLAVQLLATHLKLESVALPDELRMIKKIDRDDANPSDLMDQVTAEIDWPTALLEKDLTSVAVEVETSSPARTFAGGSPWGTIITLTDLIDEWGAESFRQLAREIWALQPPFEVESNSRSDFKVSMIAADEEVQQSFDEQMSKILDISIAIVTGTLVDEGEPPRSGAAQIVLPQKLNEESEHEQDLEPTGPSRTLQLDIKLFRSAPVAVDVEIRNCQIEAFEYELRVFDLVNRQPAGIKVSDARDYMKQFGGVHIYDSSFRLPYYGSENDWLNLELDHARRLSRSQLLPERLHVQDAMQDLPNTSRIFGSVSISTSAEQRAARRDGRRPSDALNIQVTRDRLDDNLALRQLSRAVRIGIDLYALERSRSKARGLVKRTARPIVDVGPRLTEASAVVEALKDKLPETSYATLKDAIQMVTVDSAEQRRETTAYASLLGALATAGITSLAYEHEVSRQRASIVAVARDLERLAGEATEDVGRRLAGHAHDLDVWVRRAENIRALFRPLVDDEGRTKSERWKAFNLVEDVVEQTEVLARRTPVDYMDVDRDLRVPFGSYAAWSAVLQNLLTNAFVATLTEKPAHVRVESEGTDAAGCLRVMNNGVRVPVDDAERLFEPFERFGDATRARRLGLGGSGLGLTIVRMMVNEFGCTVRFVEPPEGWSTSVEVRWKGRA